MICGYRTERRRHKRLRVTLAVLYRIESPDFVRRILADREFEGNTIDLSEGGVAIIVGHYLPTETKLYIKLIVFEEEHTGAAKFYDALTLSGEVRACSYIGDCEYRLSICFQGVDQKRHHRLSDLIHSSLKPELVPC